VLKAADIANTVRMCALIALLCVQYWLLLMLSVHHWCAGASTGSPLRRDAAVTSNRWAGRFASAGGLAAGSQPFQGSPSGEGLLPPTQERSS
jgi:hypothetical protein